MNDSNTAAWSELVERSPARAAPAAYAQSIGT